MDTTTTTTLPRLTAADAERLLREAAAYLLLVDAFRAEGVEPAWGRPEAPAWPPAELPSDIEDDGTPS
jgi:hypothetical protein